MLPIARTQNNSWCASNCEKRVFDPPQTQTCSLQRQQYLDSNQHRLLFPFLAQHTYLLSHAFCLSRNSAAADAQGGASGHMALSRAESNAWIPGPDPTAQMLWGCKSCHPRTLDLLLAHCIYDHQAWAGLLLIQVSVFSTTLSTLTLSPM